MRSGILKRWLMDILACPIDKHHPLELHVFEEKDEIVEGLIVCPKCLRWYPIRDEIPEKILLEGKPFNLKSGMQKKS